MNTNDKNVTTLIFTALLTAITVVTTMFLKVPLGVGYVHLGDSIVFLAVLVLPLPYAIFVGAVGTALADVFSGYAAWSPWSLGIMAVCVIVTRLVAGNGPGATMPRKTVKTILTIPMRELTGYLAGIICVAAGYCVAEIFIYGASIAAFASIPFNLAQAATGAVVAVLLSTVLYKTPIATNFAYKR